MPRQPLLIIGAGDHGRVVLDMARSLDLPLAGFIEPDAGGRPRGAIVDRVPVLGDLAESESWITQFPRWRFVVGLGNNRQRKAAYSTALQLGLVPMSLVHPTAAVLGGAEVGPGSQICAGVIIGVASVVLFKRTSRA